MTNTDDYYAQRIEELTALTAALESSAITTPGIRTLTLTNRQLVALQVLVRAEVRSVENEEKERKEIFAALDRLCATA